MRSEGRYAAKQSSRNERVCASRGTIGAFGEALNYPSSSFPPELSGSTLLAAAISLRRSNPLMSLRAASTAYDAGLAYQTNVVRECMYDSRQSQLTRRYLRHRLACSSNDICRALQCSTIGEGEKKRPKLNSPEWRKKALRMDF